MTDDRDEVRSRIDIVDLISREGIRLKRTGKNYSGLCPFHADKRPSFSVSPETGRYKCFSCGESGDVFTWVMKRQNVEFVEALRQLAREAGVTLRTANEAPRTDRELHETAMGEALSFYREHLPKSAKAVEYCRKRDLDEKILDEWQIGYAPEVGDALATHLKRKGLPLAECKSLFLVEEDSSGGYYDKFRGRLMFPIWDEKGALVAFGGRLLGDGHPKYINSGDTPLYRKSRVLYGMNRSREALNRDRVAVLCEGYLDVIACHRSGVKSAVASLGTSMTDEQARLLKRWADEVVILYDSDAAGQKAAQRAVEILRPVGLRVRVALMPPGDDPDTLLRSKGPEAVIAATRAGLSPVDYRLQTIERDFNPADEVFWVEVVNTLAEAESNIEVTAHIHRFAGMYPGSRDVQQAYRALGAEINRARRDNKKVGAKEAEVVQNPVKRNVLRGRLLGPERVIFRALLSDSYRRFAYMHSRRVELFESGIARELSEAVRRAFPVEPPEGATSVWLSRIEPDSTRQALNDLLTDTWEDPLTEQVLSDAIQALMEKSERRARTDMLRTGEDRNAVFERLRKAKPDLLAKPKEDDELF